jgi:hypothetical protein
MRAIMGNKYFVPYTAISNIPTKPVDLASPWAKHALLKGSHKTIHETIIISLRN